jgi:hypothetical protein
VLVFDSERLGGDTRRNFNNLTTTLRKRQKKGLRSLNNFCGKPTGKLPMKLPGERKSKGVTRERYKELEEKLAVNLRSSRGVLESFINKCRRRLDNGLKRERFTKRRKRRPRMKRIEE